MSSAINIIRNFLRLEKQRRYDNQAVIGGLEKALSIWSLQAENENIPKDIIETINQQMIGYRDKSFIEREIIINSLLSFISSDKQTDTAQSISIEMEKSITNKKSRISYVDGLLAPLTVIGGIGAKKAALLSKLNLQTLHDLLHYYPRRYDDFSKLKTINQLEYNEEATIIGRVENVSGRSAKNSRIKIIEAVISDGTGIIRLTWFNQPWISNQLSSNDTLVISGKVDMYLGRLVINNPDFESIEKEQLHTNRIVPIYRLTEGIKQKWLRRVMFQTIVFWSERLVEYLPSWIVDEENMISFSTAIRAVHFPENKQELDNAINRLSFDEIFFLQYGVLQQKREWSSAVAQKFELNNDKYLKEIRNLPFQLTKAQEIAIGEIRNDIKSGKPMNRLLQGDVGSGKTIVSRFAIEPIITNGAQAAVMAPTSVLAEQHFNNFRNMFIKDSVLLEDEIELLVGEIPENKKAFIRENLKSGKIKLIIGTHALFEEPIQFNNFQLAVIDEQHRFGVEQRAALRNKGDNPHLLVMTATPIPRSLALTIYGDLDISLIDEMPEGRKPTETYLLFPTEREKAYQIISSQIEKGHQAFVIYPQIESSVNGNDESLAVLDAYKKLQKEIFPNFKLTYLHGRLKQTEKETILAKFRNREFDILVSTTVIEVGMDIPNATVVVIEGAERFGLAQLHQIRGRVGRGGNISYCILIPSQDNFLDNERLKIMEKTNDGFALAEYDLKLRGPGDFLGTRQSGFSGIRLASLTNIGLIERARKRALALFNIDPNLTKPEHLALKLELERNWQIRSSDIS